MSKEKPSIPKGTRDFGPVKMARRNYIFDVIRQTFEKFGFMPLETPAMENLSVLTGKYGDEGDKLLYRILNSGDFLSKTNLEDLGKGYKQVTPKVANKGLRYDLTVPFARYVVMNSHEITFPFKRYQIQPVWRADRPQKGRYREFYQCDADVVGTDSLICEAENILMINEVFTLLGIELFIIKLNNRKILAGITEVIGAPGKETEFAVAIDKLDKIGKERVYEELTATGFTADSLQKLLPIMNMKGSNKEKLELLRKVLSGSESGLKGVDELEEIFGYLENFGLEDNHTILDVTLARGLNYYTGSIFEVGALNSGIKGSLSGGGRYDNLTGVFGMDGVSGVGFSFGVDRIYDVMAEINAFPDRNLISTQVMIVNFDAVSAAHSLRILTRLRQVGISSEIYPDSAKVKKQMSYANKKNIPYVLMAGSQEIEEKKYGLKNMTTGEQTRLSIEDIIDLLKG